MELVATRLEVPRKTVNLGSLAIGFAPLLALSALFAFRADILLPQQVEEVDPIYYPAVAVVFVSTTSAEREVSFDASVEADRRVALRADERSRVVAVPTKVGREVSAGDPLCRITPTGGTPLVLFSPIDGVVSSVNAGPGTVLEAGQPCVTILDPSSLIARGAMSPHQAKVIVPGDPVNVTTASGSAQSAVRVIYPDTDNNPENTLPFEVGLSGVPGAAEGQAAKITVSTEQILPMLVPFRSLTLVQGSGMSVRIVTGRGPTGRITTLPVTIVATTRDGFYVDGLPTEARLVVNDDRYTIPDDGEMVRIGQVG
ncbi:MAG: HlyD family efflux transporter periplasmic adaptor subunit [Pseudomonadota bacterium]